MARSAADKSRKQEKSILKLNRKTSSNWFESQVYANLPAIIVEMLMFLNLKNPQHLDHINRAEYRRAINSTLVMGSSGSLEGIPEESCTFKGKFKLKFDLYFRARSNSSNSSRVSLRDVLRSLVDSEDADDGVPQVIALHSYDDDKVADARDELEGLLLSENALIHFEITEEPSCMVRKLWQLEVGLALKDQVWSTQGSECGDSKLLAMGIIVGGEKEAFVKNATHIARRWKSAREADILLAKSGVPVFFCSMFNGLRMDLKELREDNEDKHMAHQKEIQALKENMDGLKENMDGLKETVQTVERKMDEGFSEHQKEIQALKENMDGLKENMDGLKETVQTVERKMDEGFSEHQKEIQALKENMDGLKENMDGLKQTVDGLKQTVQTVERKMDEGFSVCIRALRGVSLY
ncbi:hypothetical protein GUITHDRAFT_107516 [Guillardia theta CCMP2712]|uniref:Uncharacterized protein n=1 Tax=Guillardia theta (strain CCMP2712) TaxID=905079 RepID=L1JF30_GUITC|nr:hypothetical protein GUITHDRAFT_107516 [Guillardia theta CCMP2712]EKX46739.1 hypothetical protein GUITHDRAFT_107516 [Guillardia theta CCMP2712]|eukprot:XP_005833719.1 hypothetical protein GUITHDRAFT_107516 [Guillardia theta CCMP2712]